MERTGALLDVGYLKTCRKKKHKELESLEKKSETGRRGIQHQFTQANGGGFVCKARAGRSEAEKTATGAYSTNVSQLIKLAGTYPIIEELMEYREISKLVSTYIDALPKLADKENRSHTHFDSFGTATGRPPSQNPNLQNIPKKTERGREVRRAFIADKGCKLVDFDYSQIDLRAA